MLWDLNIYMYNIQVFYTFLILNNLIFYDHNKLFFSTLPLSPIFNDLEFFLCHESQYFSQNLFFNV